MTSRLMPLTLVLVLVVGCAGREPARPGAAVQSPLERAFAEIDRAYVEPPDFAVLAAGAVQAVADAVPALALRVTESAEQTEVSYAAGAERRTRVVPRRATRDQAFKEISALLQAAREASPGGLDLEGAMIVQALRRLDPDSSYLDREAYRELLGVSTAGVAGVGLELTMPGGALTIVAPLEGSPAQSAGLQTGDRLEKIDGASTKSMSLAQAVRRLRGAAGTKIVLTIARDGWTEPRDIDVMRARLARVGVQRRELGAGVAYVKLSPFDEQTAPDLAAALAGFETTGVKALVLDLRNNPGGLVTAAVEVAEQFLDNGRLIVYTEGRLRTQNLRFSAHATKVFRGVPLAVLVNGGSAGSSEIVAQALKEWGRASIVGTTTIGRGLVQTIIPLPGDTALKLTTARFFSPKGRSIHGTGVTPDVRVEPGELSGGPLRMPAEELIARDAQLRAAVEHLASQRR